MKIVLCSDNHCNKEVLKKILYDNPKADYYWHLGDSEIDDIDTIKPFISVMGNNDFDYSLPRRRIISIGNFTFLLIHGHGYTFGGYDDLAKLAKECNCNVVLFGHTHMKTDIFIDNIHLINPGSCFHNRDYKGPSYCILTIDDDNLKVEFKSL